MELKGCISFIIGDLNGDVIPLFKKSHDKPISKQGSQLYNFMVEYTMCPVNISQKAKGSPYTFYGNNGKSCIDYVVVPNDFMEYVQDCLTLEYDSLNTSDHVPVVATFNMGCVPKTNIEIKSKKKLRWDKLSQENMKIKYTDPVDYDFKLILDDMTVCEISPTNIDDFLNRIINVLRKAEKAIPVSKFRKNLRPYWCKDLSVMKRSKIDTYNAWVRAGKPRETNCVLKLRYNEARKNFCKKLKQLHREYEQSRIDEAVRSAEVDHSTFWKLLKKARNSGKVKVSAVKNNSKKVVYSIEEILEVWRKHFSKLCIPRESENVDECHRQEVERMVREWADMKDEGLFMQDEFFICEIKAAIKTLNAHKAPGIDEVTKEHLSNAGETINAVLCNFFNWIIQVEHIPEIFRRGIQIPLYKGKNTSTLDIDNFRGITLLSVFNKLFEILIWKRIETWWNYNDILSRNQGACKKGVSSLHTALLLQETVSFNLELHEKVYVTYLDVSKAFDSAWTEGLFYQLRDLGITGKLWRLLYFSYIDFRCKVRIQDKFSKMYSMRCGIHQGGFLSLLKYAAFINSL